MITLIYGGSSSGKSSYAEDYVCNSKYKNKYYLATMKSGDKETEERIKRHRSMRQGKDFVTVELPYDIVNAIEPDADSIILLECMSNLVANEMFRDGKINKASYIVDKILKDINELEAKAGSLVIVSNDVFEDGLQYDETTKEYLRALGEVNAKIAQMADKAVEVIVGIGVER
ncbi:adenosylcobinamide kinase /adenosylcobinamide-phosphate guanylyltransferase [Pseudobutyrivibrio sp. 49]|uniref:bifunctional adenosylcobinamide kinase/adenosylcobinamide-phosphate guanylyltransferase n=1 Tax=unclassified Pseudobutyrivibrio TaxID=2638619 RepID=UPI0008898F17|nr:MULTISPECIES: bifunctional adenosylcobinamide kinase/adenosylcobinamide-phosphate guanylyltransferase [unclassified Pseudobutyrivibrio]SDH30137.1 adenosylcobinamide kinase /adenosylcobinamide-phosphate guanylyltransferase [Pseudobutyrivibrio sp. 49]SFN50877.1 adenosylcobinamide kinase /adenosylcobinamide-phosphate guanylyltransferase [Pseudobutyrivibrio sp. UC1225]